MNINTVVFDLGGVLIDWNPRYLYKKIFTDEEEMEWFLTNVCHGEWNVMQDAGRTFEDGIAELVPQFPKYKSEIEAYHERWEEMLGGPISGTVDILKEVRDTDDVEIFSLTNWSRQTFPIALQRFEFLHWFKGILVSGEEGMKKPDHEIYELLAKRFSIEAEKTIFIDDSQPNITAASELGFHVIHFRSPEQLKADLVAKGITS